MRFGLSDDYPTDAIEEASDAAAPTLVGSAVVIFPQPLADTGNGEEGRTVGKPYVVVAREYISASGWWWYYNYYVNAKVNGPIWLQAYNPRNTRWEIWRGIMRLPTYSNQSRARAEPTYLQFECRFTQLVFVEAA